MTADRISALRQLWQEAFGDAEAFLNAFFSVGFSPERCHCILENDLPVSALYWFDCELGRRRLAYIYGVATRKSHRGRGLARRLMAQTHDILRSRGYSGVVLVPEKPYLFDFYRRLGYQTTCTMAEFSCIWGDTPVPLREINADEYARLRRKWLPNGGVVQQAQTLAFLQCYGRFYAGEDFLLAGEILYGNLIAQELLGNPQAAPGILRALSISQGRFRTPGTGKDIGMFLPLTEDCPAPAYFGLALD